MAIENDGILLIGVCTKSFSLSNPAPKTIGVERRNENLAASSLERPENNPVVIVIPERDTPGIIAKACDKPIKKLLLKSISSTFTLLLYFLFAMYNIIPIIISIVPIRPRFLKAVSACFSNSFPIIAPGMAAITISQNNLPSLDFGFVIPE